MSITNASDLANFASNASRLTITADGKAGIGTTSPLGFLHIESPAATAGWQVRTDSIGLANESGFYRDASDNYEVVLRNGLGGLSYIKNNGNATDANLVFFPDGIERIRIDSSGRLLAGTSTVIANKSYLNASINPQIEIDGIGISSATLSITNWSGISTSPAHVVLSKSKSGIVGTRTLVANNDDIGAVVFTADDTSAFITVASIIAEVDGPTGAGDIPGRLVFSTTAIGSGISTERFRITNDGVRAYNQPAPAAVNATTTLTVANLKTGIITSTSAVATDMTLPTGTDTQAGFSSTSTYDNFTFEWSVINTGPSLVRILANTAHAVVGLGSVATGTSGRFASRRTAANTFVSYRLT
jgi:hypothetical protein